MEYNTSIYPGTLPKNITGLFITQEVNGTWILKHFEDGSLIDYIDNIDSENDSIHGIINSYLFSINYNEAFIDVYVDPSILDEFERNLEELPLDDIDLFSIEDDNESIVTPQERAKIEAELEDEAEDAFTRFCDN